MFVTSSDIFLNTMIFFILRFDVYL